MYQLAIMSRLSMIQSGKYFNHIFYKLQKRKGKMYGFVSQGKIPIEETAYSYLII